MVCSFFSSCSKTVWETSSEIINILNMYVYPQIPFLLKGNQSILLRKVDKLEEYVFFLQQQLDIWYMERKYDKQALKIENNDLSQEVLLSLKSISFKSCPLFALQEERSFNEEYYMNKLHSYITGLSTIIAALIKWLFFLFILENKIYGVGKVHYLLKELFYKKVF